MLGKLLKYDIKATGRTFLPLYGALLVFAVVTRLFIGNVFRFNEMAQRFEDSGAFQISGVIAMSVYFAIIVAIFVVTIIMMIQRFQKNLLSDEGYLMFTLPVKPWKHVATKLINSVLWIIVSGIATLLSVAVLLMSREIWNAIPQAFVWLITHINENFGAEGYLFGFEVLAVLFMQLIVFILLVYASISLGHLFARHRTLASFGAFLVLNMISQLIEWIAGKLSVSAYPDLLDIFSVNPTAGHGFLWLGICVNLAFAAGYFLITNYVLSRRLNLE